MEHLTMFYLLLLCSLQWLSLTKMHAQLGMNAFFLLHLTFNLKLTRPTVGIQITTVAYNSLMYPFVTPVTKRLYF